jgi:hypothetical protein
MIYLLPKFNMPNCNDLFIIALKSEAKYIFHVAGMFFYVTQKLT